MNAFELDAQIVTPSADSTATPYSITSVLTKAVCTKTPVCSKATCGCTVNSACTSGCLGRDGR